MFTVPGDGVLDFSPVTEFVKNTEYSGWLVLEVEQDPTKAPALEAVTRGIQFVKSLMGLN